jgi:hypothetical protein
MSPCPPLRARIARFFLLTVVASLAGPYAASAAVFTTEFADTTGNTGYFPSVQVDAQARTHVAYIRQPDGVVLYLGPGGKPEVADSTGLPSYHVSLALGPDGQPRIAYQICRVGPDSSQVRFAEKTGGVWRAEVVVSTLAALSGVSLASDGAGRPCLAYTHSQILKYARRDAGIWAIETVKSTGVVTIGCGTQLTSSALALDASDHPFIAVAPGSKGLLVASNPGDGWVMDTTGVAGTLASIALDGAGRPRVALLSGGLRYATKDGGTWTFEAVAADATGPPSLTTAGSDTPRIGYRTATGNLKYTWWGRGAWNTETVDAGGDVGEHVSLALDPRAIPRFAYQDASGLDLKVASGPHPLAVTVDSLGNVGMWTSLAMSPAGQPAIAYFDATNRALKYATLANGIWTTQVVDTDAGRCASLAFDAGGNPRIAYLQAPVESQGSDVWPYPSVVKYAAATAGQWTIETVGTEPVVGDYTSLALDGAGEPHVSFHSYDSGLWYARKQGATWMLEHVEGYNDQPGYWSSIAVDAMGQPHIGYWYDYSITHGNYRYATRTEGGWTVEQLTGETGTFYPFVGSALALTPDGRPAIVYQRPYWWAGDPDGLVLKTRSGSGWVSEMLGSAYLVELWSCALTFDADGAAHVTFLGAGQDLQYAVKGDVWHGFTLDNSSPSSGWHSSVKVGADGVLHASHYDRTLGDLRYVRVGHPIDLVGVRPSPQPAPRLALARVWPNPARGGALTVEFAVPAAAEVSLQMLDVRGRLVAERAPERRDAGLHRVRWDAGRVSPGVYFLRLRGADGAAAVTRVAVLP